MKSKPGLYWNGTDLTFGFWIMQPSRTLYYSGTPVKGGKWSIAKSKPEHLVFLCGLDGTLEDAK